MQKPTEDGLLEVLKEIRNWVQAAAYAPVRALLESELPDPKARAAYQMLDGSSSMEQVRVACKMSPNAPMALANRWVSAGLMEVNADKKRVRRFDLADFGLIGADNQGKGSARE
jgi:hypothetical protein